jgi:hypothetical protein
MHISLWRSLQLKSANAGVTPKGAQRSERDCTRCFAGGDNAARKVLGVVVVAVVIRSLPAGAGCVEANLHPASCGANRSVGINFDATSVRRTSMAALLVACRRWVSEKDFITCLWARDAARLVRPWPSQLAAAMFWCGS